jgi:histone H3/H4
MTEIPKASVENIMREILKRHKNASRISSDAVERLTHVIDEIGLDIGKSAERLAKHAGRETVNDSDVKLALR